MWLAGLLATVLAGSPGVGAPVRAWDRPPLPPPPAHAVVVRPAPAGWALRPLPADPRTGLVAAGLSAAVVAYGALNWGYGSSPFHVRDEGWFGAGSRYGGADKAGHVLAAHILTAGVSTLHRGWGHDRTTSAAIGAWTAFGVMAVVEAADGFSEEHGFSFEDLACDAAGCLFGYWHEASPGFARLLDLRWEWWPSSSPVSGARFDPTTGYESSTYLLALNVGAALPRTPLPLDLLDLQVGYQVRGIDGPLDDRERQVVFGVGLNLANLFRRLGWGGIGRWFDYYQPPGISLRVVTSLD